MTTADRDDKDNRPSGNANKGFASMDRARQREIASKGGRIAHERGTAHEFNSVEAREAGRKGGKVAHERGTAHEFSSEEARAAGRKGGKALHGRAAPQSAPEAAAATDTKSDLVEPAAPSNSS